MRFILDMVKRHLFCIFVFLHQLAHQFIHQPGHSGGAHWASVRFLPSMDSHVLGQVPLYNCCYGHLQYDTAIINHLVHELLVTDGARMGEVALVPVLAPLQGSVVAKLLPTLLTDIPATFLVRGEKSQRWSKKRSERKRENSLPHS